MMMRSETVRRWAIGLFLIGAVVSTASRSAEAGKYNMTLDVGSAAPNFQNLPGVDDKSHSLADWKDAAVVVVVFTCNTCPTAVDYEERIQTLVKKYADGGKVAVVAINANQVAGDQLPKMKERAAEKKFGFTYLRDDSQQTAKAFGATYTPEFFVLDAQRKVAYMGAFDDSTSPDKVQVKYVEAAVDALLAGAKPETTETIARGCLVRYARQRAKKNP